MDRIFLLHDHGQDLYFQSILDMYLNIVLLLLSRPGLICIPLVDLSGKQKSDLLNSEPISEDEVAQ